ncbi:MAG: hypothetical protein PHT85_13420, partial [Methylovulum sp.]|nr:hypothetical protein [Methylovulum sp.]
MAIKTRQSKEELFQKADNGNADAMYSIGYRYLKGVGGLPKDQNKAVEWFTKSANAGSSNAAGMISKLPSINQTVNTTVNTAATVSYPLSQPIAQQDNSPSGWIILLASSIFVWVIFGRNKKIRQSNYVEKRTIADILFAGLFSIFYVGLGILTLSAIGFDKFGIGASLVILVVLFLFIAHKKKAYKIANIKRTIELIDTVINEHIATLSLKRKQMIMRDDYGNVFDDKWQREIDYFIDKVLKKDQRLKDLLGSQKKRNGDNDLSYPTRSDIQGMIIRAVAIHDELRRQDGAEHYGNIDIEPLSPIEFEHFCADILEAN